MRDKLPLSSPARQPGGRDGAAIDDVLGAVDGPGTVADQECDEFGGFGGLRGPPDGDAAEGVHDLLQRCGHVDACALGDAVEGQFDQIEEARLPAARAGALCRLR